MRSSRTNARRLVGPRKVAEILVDAEGVARVVDLDDAHETFVLPPPPPAEIRFEFTVNGERRLPGDLSLWLDGEVSARRREDPAHGELHVFVTRPTAGTELQFHVAHGGRGTHSKVLPPLPETGALVVPVAVRRGPTGMAIARVHTGETARVVAGGPPAELLLDASSVTSVNVVWKVPEGESAEFLELETPGRRREAPMWRAWESGWPLVPGDRATNRLDLDRNHPPPLRVRHPYLVGSRWNDAIDLTRPGDLRRALRRGDEFVMAPPPAGKVRLLIDPVAAAPVELDDVAFDGGPQDLGRLRFARGSTLRVHARATPPFAAPCTVARATRIDGIPYERASPNRPSTRIPTDPEIRALGPGLFRVTLESDWRLRRKTWSGEVRVDGVRDAELTIVTD